MIKIHLRFLSFSIPIWLNRWHFWPMSWLLALNHHRDQGTNKWLHPRSIVNIVACLNCYIPYETMGVIAHPRVNPLLVKEAPGNTRARALAATVQIKLSAANLDPDLCRHMVSNHRRLVFVCSTVCSGTDQRKHESSASLAFVFWGIYGGFPSQRAGNVENVSIWWRHHDTNAWTMCIVWGM